MPGELTVKCNCQDTPPDDVLCTEELWLYWSYGSYSSAISFSEYTLTGTLDGVAKDLITTGGTHYVLIDPRWSLADNWNTLQGSYAVFDTLFYGNCIPHFASIQSWIDQNYLCVKLSTGETLEQWSVRAVITGTGSEVDCASPTACCHPRMEATPIYSGQLVYIKCSSPFSDCPYGFSGTYTYNPPPKPFDALGTALGSTTRLCAEGGTPPYTFMIESGALGGGMTLNPDGSITGVPNGQPGSSFVVFCVVDSIGQKVCTECITNPCPSCNNPTDNVFY